jgi:magnesium-transporting ATPase (P-type)
VLSSYDPDRIIYVGECVSEQPNSELYSYTGKITICEETFSLSANQLLLKGSVLRNTEWVLGICVFTGLDTKLMMNSQQVRHKQSKVEKKMNVLVIYIVVVQIILCMILAIIGSFWYKHSSSEDYYLPFSYSVGSAGVITFF